MNPNGYTSRQYAEHRTTVYEDRAREIHEAENEARPGRPRIQPAEIEYVRHAAEADVLTFISLV